LKVLKWIGYLVFGVAVVLAALLGAARFNDGPLALFPGGPLEAGEFVLEPVVDWSFARDIAEVELQLEGDDTSRTVWIIVDGANGYVPASLEFPPFKTWHKRADKDGRAILRIDGRKYRITMRRVDDEGLLASVKAEGARKYGSGPPGSGVWYFAISSRAG